MTTASEFSPQNLDVESNNQELAISDGKALVALWRRREAHDHKVFFGNKSSPGNRDLIYDRLYDIMYQRHDLSQSIACLQRTVIPDLFWGARTVTKVAPEVEFFLDLADILVSP